MNHPADRTRRRLLAAGVAALVSVRHAVAASEDLQAAVRAFAGDAPVRSGRVKLDIAALVENGNTVPITVSVDSPMSADNFVKTIAVFNELNPQREVAMFHLTPRSGRATVSTRIRLATTQKLVALARLSDGSVWSATAEVVVTLAGCVES
jgi:sulfur-oxidizing protein SoxY